MTALDTVDWALDEALATLVATQSVKWRASVILGVARTAKTATSTTHREEGTCTLHMVERVG